MALERFIAFRYLRGKRRTGLISIITWISIVGVVVGTFALVVALSIANGFEREVRDRIVGTLAHAKIMQYHDQPIVNYDSVMAIVRKQPNVTGAAPYISGKGGVEYEKTQEGVVIYGIDTRFEPKVTEIHSQIKHGAFNLDSIESDRDRRLPGVIIGLGLADRLGVRPGSEIVVGTLTAQGSALDAQPRMMRLCVTGIFETGMYEYDLSLIYISLESARFLMNMPEGVEGIQIRTNNMFHADKIAQKVKNALGGYPYTCMDWKSQNRSLFEWMSLEKIVIFIVISFIILIAAFNIVSSLMMMIMEKRREIGILMSMGASSQSIMKIFVINGAVIGFFGATGGTLLGVVLCSIQARWQLIPLPGDIYFINKLPVMIQWVDVLIVYVSAYLICLSATIYPALLASRILPAESIRYE